MQTLILADNQDVTRCGMKSIALDFCPLCNCVEVTDWGCLTESLLTFPVACVVLDYTLFDCTLNQLLVLHERFPQVHFVLFSDQLEKDFIWRVLFAGPRFHVLMKDASLTEIRQCLASIEGNQQFISRKVQALLEEERKKGSEEVYPLTQTEKEILRSMALGRSTKEIAADRFLSVYTVATHRKNIFRKLKVNNAHEAIRYALRAGIVDTMEYCI